MESKQFTQEDFLSAKKFYYELLKNAYLKEVDIATDKTYAQQYYKRILFENNSIIPYNTLFFENLIFTFNHFKRLNETNSIQNTLDLLDSIREESMQAFNLTKGIIEANGTLILLETLPKFYQYLLKNEYCTLDEIIYLENIAINSTVENTVALFSLYEATQELLFEFNTPEHTELEEINQENLQEETKNLGKYTVAQTSMIMYYLLIGYGTDVKRNANLSGITKLIHSITGKPLKKIVNSDYYQKLRTHVNQKSTSQTLVNLLSIRPLFVEHHLIEVVKLIDNEISKLKSN